MTNNSKVVDGACRVGSGDGLEGVWSVGDWTVAWSPLAGHNARLPSQTTHVSTNGKGLGDAPLFEFATSMWSIDFDLFSAVGGGFADNRWECDDFPDGPSRTTHHLIYVRNRPTCTNITAKPSCTDWYLAGNTSSGTYCVHPPNAATPLFAYCDHSEGGGWMLLWSYKHIGGTTPSLVPGVLPTDPVNGFSHARACNDVGYRQGDIAEVRFYCETSGHSRKIHFMTNNSKVVDGVCRVRNNATVTAAAASWGVSDWKYGWTPLSAHTGNLPAVTRLLSYQIMALKHSIQYLEGLIDKDGG